ncbi:cob(I)yrinic acid a,c-diamide adenosyltransferase [Proteiniclasticum ruminis]|uniref:Cob(I)yrinic acid a,c-diamide adenosyltransferase n=1 Tax=Proteiniclasticum ruminis TaxID=398199 RepID=A0A1I4Y2V2_9CLOT|nr:cob(I)yrinic acid a,c-diamide adenosyltransferase [Proteiniclasticum ruminis]SFN32392.1 cob(I)yrinic acid a,c-diamide adenosyltransferase [Proteiniclasticum ruminis]
MNSKGQIHIYTGEGKGKTTAALGLSMRAAGRDRKVLFVQFLKGQDTGEQFLMRKIPQITHVKLANARTFFHALTAEEQKSLLEETEKEWESLYKQIMDGGFDLVVLDEIMAAMYLGIIPESKVVTLLQEKPFQMELVLTGRKAPDLISKEAGLITEMRKIRHYYDQGIQSREGTEY